MKYTIVLDPGHGGTDRANRGTQGYIEADGVLQLSKFLYNMLSKHPEFNIIMTRKDNTYVSNTERGNIAIRNNADLFMSLHTNAFHDPSVGGSEVYYSVDLPYDQSWASEISSAISKEFGINDRGAKVKESTKHPNEDYYTVIDVAQDGGVPHVLLVESMFHSNPKEELLLLDHNNLLKIAHILHDVICRMFGVSNEVLDPKDQEISRLNQEITELRTIIIDQSIKIREYEDIFNSIRNLYKLLRRCN